MSNSSFEIYNQDSPLPSSILELYRPFSLPELGPESRSDTLSSREIRSRLTEALADSGSSVQELSDLLLSVLLLWHDHLDASHDISQNLHSSEGSYLHGIMHRREPDYWNSKYWFRQSGNHPEARQLSEKVVSILEEIPWTPANALANNWDSVRFVDLVNQALNQDRSEEAADCLKQFQALEFETFMEHIWEMYK